MTAAEGPHVLLTFKVHEEDGQYVGRCEELGISSCAKSIDKAFKRALEATDLYLITIEEEGERERIFAERGITLHHGHDVHGQMPVCVAPDNEFVSLRSLAVHAFA